MNATDLDGGFAAWKRAGLPSPTRPAERRARAGSARGRAHHRLVEGETARRALERRRAEGEDAPSDATSQ